MHSKYTPKYCGPKNFPSFKYEHQFRFNLFSLIEGWKKIDFNCHRSICNP